VFESLAASAAPWLDKLVIEFPQFGFVVRPQATVWAVAAFALAIVLLDSFDISMPRGDSIGVSGALTAAALILLGPFWAAAICVASVLVTHLARHGTDMRRRAGASVFARLAAIVAGSLTAWMLSAFASSAYDSVLGAALVPAVYLTTDLVAAQFMAAHGTGRPLGRLLRGNFRMQAPLLVAQWSASVLLLITYVGVGSVEATADVAEASAKGMGPWSLVPVVALLFLIRQSYAMLMDIRELYRATVEVLVEAAEGQDARRTGHAERTAAVARAIAMRIGLSPNRVERISYAALLHDIDAISNSSELIAEDEVTAPIAPVGTSSAVFEGVHFFDDVLPIIRICDGYLPEGPPTDDDLLAGFIVAIASDVDAAAHAEVASAHLGNSVDRVAPWLSSAAKSSVVGATLALGYRVPAVG
jgi:hypothetical protein